MKFAHMAFAASVALLPSVSRAEQPPICKAEKSSGWPNNYDVISYCRYRFPAPVPGRVVEFEIEGRFILIDHGTEVDLAPFDGPS